MKTLRLAIMMLGSLELGAMSLEQTENPSGAESSKLQAESSTNIVAQTLFEDGSTNTWTQADLQAALGLLNRKYHREVKTEAGRVAWHGKRVSYVENTNTLTVVSTYADGTQFADPFTARAPQSLASRMAAAEKMKKKRRAETMPPGLAAKAEERDEAAQTTNEVTVVVGPR